ncbi:MAG TPA: class I SAM-dependent methyltransferase [Candidatus Methylomirabilis sp.]|nr:class I SAM-dependent methyltransferase [Candidatus Methylomirabilis sp.]
MRVCLACNQVFGGAEWRCPECHWTPEVRAGYLAFSPDVATGDGGFSGQFFGELARLEEGHFWFENRNRLITWALREYFPRAESLLEIGTGTGFVLAGIRRACPTLRLCGSDIYTEALPFAELRLSGVLLMQLDARCLPFECEYDVLGAFDVLEHIQEYQEVLWRMYRACRPGGGILVTVPQHRFLWSAQDDYAFHKRRFTREELVREVRRVGFSILRVTSFVTLPFPLLLLSRLRKRKGADFDPYSEVRLQPTVNAILGAIVAVERFAIARGLILPFGGSLLLVGKRDAPGSSPP